MFSVQFKKKINKCLEENPLVEKGIIKTAAENLVMDSSILTLEFSLFFESCPVAVEAKNELFSSV